MLLPPLFLFVPVVAGLVARVPSRPLADPPPSPLGQDGAARFSVGSPLHFRRRAQPSAAAAAAAGGDTAPEPPAAADGAAEGDGTAEGADGGAPAEDSEQGAEGGEQEEDEAEAARRADPNLQKRVFAGNLPFTVRTLDPPGTEGCRCSEGLSVMC